MTQFFADRTGRGVRVAVVDSGVHAAHAHVRCVSGGAAILPDGRVGDDYVDRLGHGTAVAAAIHEKAPDAELVAVKVFHRTLATDAAVLARAIDWCVAERCSLINLSLGTSRIEHAALLDPAVARARSQRTVVVAALDDDGVRYWPGSLPGVIAVRLAWDCPREVYRASVVSDGSAVFWASGYPRDIPGVPRERNLKGLSFAVANMTGFAARALEAHPDARVEELIARLVDGAALAGS